MNSLRFKLFGGVMLLVLAAWPSLASLSTVSGLFEAGRYEDARESLVAGGEGARPAEDILWRSRLATSPAAALELLESGLKDDGVAETVRIRLALEMAEIEAGRGNHREVLEILGPLLSQDNPDLPGVVHLRAALSLRARGNLQQAREMLASVRPGDPDFVLARYYLGDIGLQQNDATLAQRYFVAAAKATDAAGANRLAAGIWRAHMATGQDQEADDLVTALQKNDPGSLALLEIRRLMQLENEERDARAAAEPVDTVVTPIVETKGRYALQLGAFSDRSLALEFVKRFQNQLPDLHIDKVRDQRGQFLYKVRTGDYVNPALARSEAKQLQKRLGIDVIMTEIGDIGGQSGR